MEKARNFALNTPRSVRFTVARMAREFYRNEKVMEEDNAWWRSLNSLFQTLIKAMAVESDARIEQRLDAIEAAIKEIQQL